MNNTMCLSNHIWVLDDSDLEQVNGAVLANIGMGIGRAVAGMTSYGLSGVNSLSLSDFAAAAWGFVFGAGGFNHLSAVAGLAVQGSIKIAISGSSSSSGGEGNIVVDESIEKKANQMTNSEKWQKGLTILGSGLLAIWWFSG